MEGEREEEREKERDHKCLCMAIHAHLWVHTIFILSLLGSGSNGTSMARSTTNQARPWVFTTVSLPGFYEEIQETRAPWEND